MTKKGQSVLEYTMVIALVATAIILMYQYVLRGTWAGIKSWEEQVNDSLGEYYSFGQGHWVLISSSWKIGYESISPPVDPCFVGETYESRWCVFGFCFCKTYRCIE